MTRIQLLLTDDWELRGDGSGDMRVLQFERIRALAQLYERYGWRGVFMVEVMQQLRHLEWGRKYSELRNFAEEWEEIVREIHARGHDVQLHVHPQWLRAQYQSGHWALDRRWSILTYAPEEMHDMLHSCKQYLEQLLRPQNADYECVLFRSGAWCAAPSADLFAILVENGIRFDLSLVHGLHYDLENLQVDYREMDEPFLPYYPDMHDARRVSYAREKIICLPTHGARAETRTVLLNWCSYLAAKIPHALRPAFVAENFLSPSAMQTNGNAVTKNYNQRWQAKHKRSPRESIAAYLSSISFRSNPASSLSALSYAQMRNVLHDIRRRAARTNWPVVPVVLANHTKDLGNIKPLEKFCALLAASPEIEVITSTQLVQNFREQHYPLTAR